MSLRKLKIQSIFYNTWVYFPIHKKLPLVPTFRQTNPNLCNVYFNVIHPFRVVCIPCVQHYLPISESYVYHACNITCPFQSYVYHECYITCPLHYLIFPHSTTASSLSSFTITLRHTTLGRTPLDEWSARSLTWQHTPLTRNKSMPPAGFEPDNPASKHSAADYHLRPRGQGIGCPTNSQ
jgi:hypothetical protein